MSAHHFIFSNRFSYRLSRHLTFWICWLFLCYIAHWLPNYSRTFGPFFSSWDVAGLLERIDKVGGWYRALVTPFLNAWYRGFLGQVGLTYFIIYFTLPAYLSATRKKSTVTLITILFFIIFLIYGYVSIKLNYAGAVRRGLRPFMPDTGYILAVWVKGLTFTIPTVLGFAIAIKLVKHWWFKQKETEQLSREKAKAELQLLKAQIHPHFLFNTLNNIYYFTLSASRKAPEMIKKLSDMLHYILNECDQPYVPLEKELKMIQDYMSLEKIRYGEQMRLNIDIDGNYQDKMICPLLLIPFIENSFKHGASRMLNDAFINLTISIEGNVLLFFIANSKPNITSTKNKNGNIGLRNVRKRLQLLYPGTHELSIVNEAETFVVFMKIQLQKLSANMSAPAKLQTREYELA